MVPTRKWEWWRVGKDDGEVPCKKKEKRVTGFSVSEPLEKKEKRKKRKERKGKERKGKERKGKERKEKKI